MRKSCTGIGLALSYVLGLATVGNAQVLIRISEEEYVHQVVSAGGKVWIAADSGAYRVDGTSPFQVLDVQVTTIAEVDGEVWLGSADGVYRVDGDMATPILRQEIGAHAITVIYSAGGVTWVGGGGLFRIADGSVTPLLNHHMIFDIRTVNGQTWIGTNRNAYRIGENGVPEGVLEDPLLVSQIVEAGGSVWLVTNRDLGRYGSCIRVKGEQVSRVLPNHEVIVIAEVEGGVWAGTPEGVLRLDGDTPRWIQIEDLASSEPVNVIAFVNGEVWVGTARRAYRRLGDGSFVPIPEMGLDLNIKGVVQGAERTWLWGGHGAYFFDDEIQIELRPPTRSIFGLNLHMGQDVTVGDVRYAAVRGEPDHGPLQGQFEAILEPDKRALKRQVAEGGFKSALEVVQTMDLGFQDLYMVARDTYGNTGYAEIHSVLIVPEVWKVWGAYGLAALVAAGGFASLKFRRFRRRKAEHRLT